MIAHANEEQRFHYWNTRTLYLIDDVLGDDDQYAISLLDQLVELNARDHTAPILLVIKSGGGSASTMGAIIDYIKAIEAPVYAQATGDVASAAAFILGVCEKGHRYVSPSARVMIHQAYRTGGVSGRLDEIDIERNELKACQDWVYQLLVEATGHSVKKLKADMRKDKWFSAQEAMDYGLADHVGICPLLLNLPVVPFSDEVMDQDSELPLVTPLRKKSRTKKVVGKDDKPD